MITKNEIYYLNRALDGEAIYGLNPEKDIVKVMESLEVTKASLIEKKIINKDESLNDLSFLILKNLEQYKNAESYIWINDMVASIDKTNYLLFFKEDENKELLFKKTTKELMLYSFVKTYSFLRSYKEVDGDVHGLSLALFMEKIKDKLEDEVLYIKKENKGHLYFYNVYYAEEGVVFRYDVLREEVNESNPKTIRKELAEILDIRVDI